MGRTAEGPVLGGLCGRWDANVDAYPRRFYLMGHATVWRKGACVDFRSTAHSSVQPTSKGPTSKRDVITLTPQVRPGGPEAELESGVSSAHYQRRERQFDSRHAASDAQAATHPHG